MLQLFCPACENVVWVEDAAPDDVVCCPECSSSIHWLARRKARLVQEPQASQHGPIDPRLVAAPPRPAAPAPAPTLPVTDEYQEIPAPSACLENAEEQDFSIPLPEPAPLYVGLPYRPEGGVSLLRLPLFLVAVLGAGVGLGVLASFLGQFCYLVLLFPLALGLALAGIIVLAGHLAQVRSPLLAGLVALTAGLLALLSMHLFDYQRTMQLLATEPFRLPEELAVRLQQAPGFVDYFPAMAELGLTISGRESGGLELGPTATWVYWGVEAFLVLLIATLAGASAARDPFCSQCKVWKEDRFLGTLHDSAVMRDHLRRGRLSALVCCRPADLLGGELVLTASVCPRCGPASPIDMHLDLNPRARRAVEHRDFPIRLTVPGEALTALEGVFHPGPTAPSR